MAEFLVKLQDANIADSGKNTRGCYKRGDLVVVVEDGHAWGKEERPPKFGVLKVPGLRPDVAQKFLAPEVGVVLGPLSGLPMIYRRRRWKIDIDGLMTAPVRSQLVNGTLTLTANQAKSLLLSKPDGKTATELGE